MVKPAYHWDREDAPFSPGLKAHLPLRMELVASTAPPRIAFEVVVREPMRSGQVPSQATLARSRDTRQEE